MQFLIFGQGNLFFFRISVNGRFILFYPRAFEVAILSISALHYSLRRGLPQSMKTKLKKKINFQRHGIESR